MQVPMFRGRILVVSDRPDVVAQLDPIIRSEGHLMLSVPNGEEAIRVLEEGIIPDLVISDPSSGNLLADLSYLPRFRQLNRLGQHLAVVDGSTPPRELGTLAARLHVEPFDALRFPFDAVVVRHALQEAMDRIRRDLESLRAEMFRETARLQQGMRDLQLEMVSALALAMEAKDPYMHGHCDRVAKLVTEVGRAMALDDESLEMLATAATLHEIGKLGVGIELLHKTTPLTADELDQIRNHTRIGAQIVKSLPSLRRLAPLIENQYTNYCDLPEKLDPDRIEYRLAAILRVVDTYDAMMSGRSYRDNLSAERVHAVLREGAGTTFHPEAIDVLLGIVAEAKAA
jgi:response regulator RpfG family c-di-GMP phosphodiesterase